MNTNAFGLTVSFASDCTVHDRLAYVFGRAWSRLTPADQALIVRDCVEDGGVADFAAYRLAIGTGNLQAYADTQRARFAKKVEPIQR